MKPVLLIGYFIVPALVYFTAGYAEHGFRALDANGLQWFLPNYLIFAAPQILWMILGRLFRFPFPVMHAGYLAATFVLLILNILLFNPMDWLMYWPLAVIFMVFSAVLVARWWPKVKELRSKSITI
jgi:hypothetical protein